MKATRITTFGKKVNLDTDKDDMIFKNHTGGHDLYAKKSVPVLFITI